jgi:hypothetical protein
MRKQAYFERGGRIFSKEGDQKGQPDIVCERVREPRRVELSEDFEPH